MSYPELLTADEKLADAKRRLSIPRIVVICGSTRFWQQMADAAWTETLAGRIVVKPDVDMKRHGAGYTDAAAVKVDLDELHRAKIRLADEVLVVGDYIGESTTREIAYSRELGKPIRFTDPQVDPAAEGPIGCRRCGDTAGPYDPATGLCENCLGGAA